MRLILAALFVLCACTGTFGELDAGPLDSGTPAADAGGVDAGDAGLVDAGSADAGHPDAGPVWDGGYERGTGCGPIDAGVVVDDGGTPAWALNAPLGAFIAIPGSEGGPGVTANAYSGFTLKEDTAELFFLAAGGHSDSSDNRVVSISLLADAPSWVLRCTPSTHPVQNGGYYDDGTMGLNPKPGSTHTYDYTAWVPQALGGHGRLMRFGLFGTWPSGFSANNVDGFDPVTNTWDLPGTWPDTKGTYGTARDHDTGEVYVAGGAWKVMPDGGALVAATGVATVRYPNAFDSKRHALFGLMYGDGQGYDLTLGVVARLNDLRAHTTSTITFTPSAALTQFMHDQPAYAGMDYDEANDRYLFYSAGDNSSGFTPVPDRIYVVTPNASTTWDLSLLTLPMGSVVPPNPPSSGAGINGRFKYVARLKGFVLLPNQSAALYFLKTSN